MPTTEATLYTIEDGAAWITLNRPENRNALSQILVTELDAHLRAAVADPNVRCIVVTGRIRPIVVRHRRTRRAPADAGLTGHASRVLPSARRRCPCF